MKDDGDVEIMGQRWDGQGNRHRDSGSVVWGVLLLLSGIMLFFNTMNAVPWSVWDYILRFWPVLLIFVGVQIILGDNILTSLVMLVLSVVIFGSIYIAALDSVGAHVLDGFRIPAQIQSLVDFIRRVRP